MERVLIKNFISLRDMGKFIFSISSVSLARSPPPNELFVLSKLLNVLILKRMDLSRQEGEC